MLGKLRKGDRVYTVLNNDPAGCVTVSEILKLDKEVILVRGFNDRNEKVALSPKEIITFEFKDTALTYSNVEDNVMFDAVKRAAVKHFSKDTENIEHVLEEGLKKEGTVSETGSLRYNTGKPQMSNIPPEFLLEMAKVMTMGAEKYGKNNWKLGNKMSVPYDSLKRHLYSFVMGETIDDESKCHHLAHLAVNAMFMWYYEKNFSELDDRDEMN